MCACVCVCVEVDDQHGACSALCCVQHSVHVFASAAEEPRNEGNADLNEEMTWSKVRM